MPRGGSQQAVAALFCSPDVLTGDGKAVLIEWTSTRVKRVVRSPMACEVAATTFGLEYGDYIRAVLAEVFFEEFNIRRWQSEIGRWPRYVAVDAKTVLDCLWSENTPQDRRVAIDASCLRDHDWTVFTRGNLQSPDRAGEPASGTGGSEFGPRVGVDACMCLRVAGRVCVCVI